MTNIPEVVTIPEIVKYWNVCDCSVRRAIDTGRTPLRGRVAKGGKYGTWLIYTDSVIRRWGMPIYPFPED